MPDRTRMFAATAVAAAALAAGGGAAAASATGVKPSSPAKDVSAIKKPAAARERQGHDAFAAVVARELHVSKARAEAALRPLFAVGYADPSSPAFAAAARALGVSPRQLNAALVHAKESMATASGEQVPGGPKSAGAKAARAKAAGSKAAGSKAAEERPGHSALAGAVAKDLHVSTARAEAALRPVFAAGEAAPSSRAFTAAARTLGVSPRTCTPERSRRLRCRKG